MQKDKYSLFDFLDFDPSHTGDGYLWKACRPVEIKENAGDVLLVIPFRKQAASMDITPDREAPLKEYTMQLRAYGDSILRIGIGFGQVAMGGSPMLEIHPDLKVKPLTCEKKKELWLVSDPSGCTRAVFDRRDPVIDHWSDLVPGPEETFEASFFPNGGKEIMIAAWDQFFPARQDALALAFVEREGYCSRATISFQAHPDEVFAGTGERFSKLDLSGQTVHLKNMDAQGVNSKRCYKNIPFFVSSRLYGIFMHTSSYGKISLADHSTRSVQLLSEDDNLDLFLIGGSSVEEILYHYRQITGFPAMPPVWSFGTWMSRMTYFSAKEILEVCARMRKEGFPVDVVHLDTGWFRTDWLCEWKFNKDRFPDPAGFISTLRQNGFRLSLWQLPYISVKAEQYEESVRNSYIGQPGGDVMQDGSNLGAMGYAGTIDFSSQHATRWYQSLLKNLLEMGVSCIKTDFGEEIHMDAVYNGMPPEKLNNLYALLYQKAVFDITREITGEGIIWARAGWAGCQRYPLHWGGDAACTWDGMAGTLKGGLHLGLSGFGFWSHDVPGFHGIPDFMNSVIPEDLYVRWTQFGVFSSHLRYHGTSKREPYHFPGIARIIRRWLRLRYCLMPYLLQEAGKIIRSGYPFTRAMIFHHAGDSTCWHIDDQYFFGDDFLVAPVMNSGNKRDIYLPEGSWVNLFDGTIITGSRWIRNFEVPLEEMPVWVKYAASVPVFPYAVSCTDEIDDLKTQHITFDNSYTGLKDSCLADLLFST